MASLPPPSPPQSEQWESDESYDSDSSSDPGVLWEESSIDCDDSRNELADLRAKIIQAKDRLSEENAHLDHVKSLSQKYYDEQDGLEAKIRKVRSEILEANDKLNHAQLKADSTEQYAAQAEQDLARLRAETQIANFQMGMSIKELGDVRKEVKEAKGELEDVLQKTKKAKRKLLDFEAGCSDLRRSQRVWWEDRQQPDSGSVAAWVRFLARYGREADASWALEQPLQNTASVPKMPERVDTEPVDSPQRETPARFEGGPISPTEPKQPNQLLAGLAQEIPFGIRQYLTGEVVAPSTASMTELRRLKYLNEKGIKDQRKAQESVGIIGEKRPRTAPSSEWDANLAEPSCPRDLIRDFNDGKEQREEETHRRIPALLEIPNEQHARPDVDDKSKDRADHGSNKHPDDQSAAAGDHARALTKPESVPRRVDYSRRERDVTKLLILLAWLALVNLVAMVSDPSGFLGSCEGLGLMAWVVIAAFPFVREVWDECAVGLRGMMEEGWMELLR